MSGEVDWVLDKADTITISVPLKRVDRDNSEILEGDIRKRGAKLEAGVIVGANLATRAGEPVGTGYDHNLDTVVGLRIEGLHYLKHGHIDPDGVEGIDFDELVRKVRRALLDSRVYPDPTVPDVDYHDLLITNESNNSAEYGDFYQYTADCVFRGYETLP